MILHQHKIVFGGSMGAGKTAAIQALSDIDVLTTEALNTDTNAHQKQLTTVGIDYGEISLDDTTQIGLYGTPGQDRFDFMWPIICQGALGAVILIDHSVQDPIADLSFYVSKFQAYTQTLVIGITHIDAKTDRSTGIYQEWLNQQPITPPIFFIDARIDKEVKLLVETLIINLELNPHSLTKTV